MVCPFLESVPMRYDNEVSVNERCDTAIGCFEAGDRPTLNILPKSMKRWGNVYRLRPRMQQMKVWSRDHAVSLTKTEKIEL